MCIRYNKSYIYIYIILYTVADKKIQVKVIGAVLKQVKRLQRKPRKNSEAPMGYEPITIFMVSDTFLFYINFQAVQLNNKLQSLMK